MQLFARHKERMIHFVTQKAQHLRDTERTRADSLMFELDSRVFIILRRRCEVVAFAVDDN